MTFGVVTVLLLLLGMLAAAFTVTLVQQAARRKQGAPNIEAIILGAVTNFFDTLGIGSFAPTTAWMKFRRMAPDAFFPAILNAGHALPTVAQSGIFLVLLGVHVDPVLLTSCIVAAVAGSFVGAPIVMRAPVRLVQAVVGVALVIAAALYAIKNLDWMPGGGSATSLETPLLVVAVLAHFVMGALMAFGIGLYAPSLILLSLLGLDPRLAFPIMASACAFLMPAASMRFVRAERIDLKIVLGLALGGIPAVLAAAYLVKSLDVVVLRWGVVVVVLYAALLLLRAAVFGEKQAAEAAPAS